MRGWRQAPAGEPGKRDQHLPKKEPSQHQEAPEAPDERGQGLPFAGLFVSDATAKGFEGGGADAACQVGGEGGAARTLMLHPCPDCPDGLVGIELHLEHCRLAWTLPRQTARCSFLLVKAQREEH